jgi:hypothetical protein
LAAQAGVPVGLFELATILRKGGEADRGRAAAAEADPEKARRTLGL